MAQGPPSRPEGSALAVLLRAPDSVPRPDLGPPAAVPREGLLWGVGRPHCSPSLLLPLAPFVPAAFDLTCLSPVTREELPCPHQPAHWQSCPADAPVLPLLNPLPDPHGPPHTAPRVLDWGWGTPSRGSCLPLAASVASSAKLRCGPRRVIAPGELVRAVGLGPRHGHMVTTGHRGRETDSGPPALSSALASPGDSPAHAAPPLLGWTVPGHFRQCDTDPLVLAAALLQCHPHSSHPPEGSSVLRVVRPSPRHSSNILVTPPRRPLSSPCPFLPNRATCFLPVWTGLFWTFYGNGQHGRLGSFVTGRTYF